MMFLRAVVIAAAILLAVVPANAGPFEEAVAAYERGDYASAMRLWRPLAEQGHAAGQFNHGLMYFSKRFIQHRVGMRIGEKPNFIAAWSQIDAAL